MIYAKISERLRTPSIAPDYWDFLQNDPQEEGNAFKPHERSLSHAQVSSFSTMLLVYIHFTHFSHLSPYSLVISIYPITKLYFLYWGTVTRVATKIRVVSTCG